MGNIESLCQGAQARAANGKMYKGHKAVLCARHFKFCPSKNVVELLLNILRVKPFLS